MKILIVEDSALVRVNLKKFISEMKGFKITGEAEDSQTAINLISKKKPDVIILDIELKDSSGFDVLKFLKSSDSFANPTIILFSNHASLYKDKSVEYKADYILDKTTEFETLLSTLKNLQEKK